jgi:hypothetical protein
MGYNNRWAPTESRQVSNGGLYSLTTPHQFHATLRGPSTTLHHAHGVGRQEREFSTSRTPTESRQVSNGGPVEPYDPVKFSTRGEVPSDAA